MAVYVLDKRGKPLMPCSEKRAKLLLARGRARVHRVKPFCIRLVDRLLENSALQDLAIKIDPGSKVTGLAVVREKAQSGTVLNLMELTHRGATIKKTLLQRAGYRRRRRSQNLRYRAPRFENRTRRDGWLPPSLQHRVDTTTSWVNRIRRWAPITKIAVERVKFDTQKIQNPEITGVEYQQGELAGYEVREYLLEKWNRTCAYCDETNVPLQVEHIHARANGGSNRVSNLTLSCGPCNQNKDTTPIEVFLSHQPARLARIKAQAKKPLRDAAAVNATRNALLEALLSIGIPIETSTGARTKFNRIRFGIPKTHALDAACVGEIASITKWQRPTLIIKATGRGDYQRTRVSASGFPRGYLTRQKRHFGFQTGDNVRAEVPSGKKVGIHLGRVAVRKSGSFNVQTLNGTVQGISYRYCHLVQRSDGYAYQHATFHQPK